MKNYGREIYSILRQGRPKPLKDVPIAMTAKATMLRSTKGHTKLRLQDKIELRILGAEAEFGTAKIRIREQRGETITVHNEEGSMPTQGTLVQRQVATTANEVFKVVEIFWGAIWQRETREETEDTEAWASIQQELEELTLPEGLDRKIEMRDLQKWKDTTRSMKTRKAPGFCGWRSEELKQLPDAQLEELIDIAQQIFDGQFGSRSMQARVVLLAKKTLKKLQRLQTHNNPVGHKSAIK